VLHHNRDSDLADVTVKDTKTGKQTVLHTTWHHPFWNAGTRGWTEAAQLKTGDKLRSPDGETTQTVAAVKVWTGLKWMQDLTVNDTHTYYVLAGSTPVLVHNCGGDEPVLFRQARVGPNFSKGGAFKGRSIYDVAGDLKAGRLSSDDIQINAFRHNGALITENNRSLTALSLAGMKPTNINIVEASQKLLGRLDEVGPVGGSASVNQSRCYAFD
jgi:hypothetical protein